MFGRSSKIFISEEEVSKSLEVVNKFKLKVFVHTPYILNLCSERTKTKEDYIVKCIKAHLSYGKRFGAKGVVVHVGKSCKLEEKDALENMRGNIIACLESSSEECPLLLETPAGQGTETLTTVPELLDFVESFHSKKLGVCVDTCHVFASGILPSEALNICCSRQECVKLVHFNDSAKDKGCCVDRHAPIGEGKIPVEDLQKCAEWCVKYGVPMLNE